MPIAKLNRSILHISGDGVIDWLLGLVTNTIDADINFAALLTPQGKIIADFFIVKEDDHILIDTAEKFSDGLIKRLSMYRLRAPITISKDDRDVYAAWGGTGDEGHTDPRHPKLGQRIITSHLEAQASSEDYDLHRLSLGVPDSEQDFDSAEIFPANANMDILHGVDFKKGCFVGQEVVSRMHRKTDVKKRMRGFKLQGELDGAQISLAGRVVGDVMHISGDYGMAMIRQDRLPSSLADSPEALKVGATEITLLDLPNENTP